MPGPPSGADDGVASVCPEVSTDAVPPTSLRWGRAEWVFLAPFFALRGAGMREELPEKVSGFFGIVN